MEPTEFGSGEVKGCEEKNNKHKVGHRCFWCELNVVIVGEPKDR